MDLTQTLRAEVREDLANLQGEVRADLRTFREEWRADLGTFRARCARISALSERVVEAGPRCSEPRFARTSATFDGSSESCDPT
jgi:hypothetical protein